MPNWAGGVLTAKGRALQAKVEAGQTLELTKMKLGSGTPEPEEIDNLTDLKQPQNIMGISSKTVENNICEVTSVILTSNINTPFYAREWGLFANDPDEGEILYMYTTDTNPDYIPDKNSALVISASYALNIAVLNVDNIIANIDPEGLITAGILEEELKKYLPIDTTYVKDVTVSNDTLTITKGDDSNNNIVINDIQQAKFSNNINKGYNNGATPLPTKTFRSDVLKLSGVGYSVQPMHCVSVRDNVNNCAGIAFSGGWDTNGFLQMAHNSPKAWMGGGSKENINWYKELAFTESPAFTGTPTAPTPETSDNSTKMATTAFVKSLFTASKQKNGWWHDNITGFTIQWGSGGSGRINYPISFSTYGVPIFIHTSNISNDYKSSVLSSNFDNNGFTANIENGGTLIWVAIGY